MGDSLSHLDDLLVQACHSLTLSLEQLNQFKLPLKTLKIAFQRPSAGVYPNPPSSNPRSAPGLRREFTI